MEKNAKPFVKEDNSFAILFVRGSSYRQVDLYSRKDHKSKSHYLYAKYGQGFYLIYTNGDTSSNKIKCKGMKCQDVVWQQDKFGKLEVKK